MICFYASDAFAAASLLAPVARFDQVTLANDKRVDNCTAACSTGIQRRGDRWFLSWSLDSIDDHFICSYVLF